MSTAYGPSVTLAQTKLVLAAAEAEAIKQNWNVAIAVVDPGGSLVGFWKRDDTQNGSVLVAQDKARTAALYRRPSKAFQDIVAGGGLGLRVMTMRDVIAAEGGVPLIVAGQVIGAVGVSGVNSDQDGIVAAAGAAALA